MDWEIFNRPNKGTVNGFLHFAIKAEHTGKVVDARVLYATHANQTGERRTCMTLWCLPRFAGFSEAMQGAASPQEEQVFPDT